MSTSLPAHEPPLPDPPGPPYARAAAMFKSLNRWFMVPVTRAGFGAWVSTPFGGAILLLRVRGRKSGLVRETPLNYIVAEGSAWVLAGFGPGSEWYRNLLANPRVEVVLPGRTFTGTATEVTTPAVRARILPAVMRSTLGPTMASGVNPLTASGEQMTRTMDWVPLIRLDPDDGWLDPTPDDPGGLGWIWRQALVLVATWLSWRVLRRVLCRRGRTSA